MSYVDAPNKKQKHPHYEHRTKKLDQKDNQFTSKKFHHIRKYSTHKKIIKAFGRIGMCLNNKPASSIPTGDLDKICFILINDYDDEDGNKLGVGPLNDGYLVGLKHHRLGYKIFYLYNPSSNEFENLLPFFMKNTEDQLTVFYSGRVDDQNGIQFCNHDTLSKSEISEIVLKNNTGSNKVVFVSDCLGGGSVFAINGGYNMVSFFVNKSGSSESKENIRSQGIFTYYFCKFIYECPHISPNRLIERMNASMNRFNKVSTCEFTNEELGENQIFVS